MLSQDHRQIRHALARVALAKAIKTPDENEPEAEHWSKSIIFNQPFLRQLQKQQQQQRQLPPNVHRRKKSIDNKPQVQKNRGNQAIVVLERKMSGLNIKKDIADTAVANRGYVPSDSEEEEDDDDDEEEEEDDDEDDDDDIKDVPQVTKVQMPIISPQRSRPHSIESMRDDISTPSRSTSSHASPLTDEDEAPSSTQNQRIHVTPPFKDDYIYHRPPQSNQSINSNNRPISMEMIDPIHYQRMQLYQTQLQYQQQIQYQQAMALQQQQHLYLMSQNPNPYYPPSTFMINDLNSPPRRKRHSTGQISPNGKGHRQHNIMNGTDARRRAEMMKNATDAANKTPSQYYSQPFHTPMTRNNHHSRSPSRNI